MNSVHFEMNEACWTSIDSLLYNKEYNETARVYRLIREAVKADLTN